MVVPEWARRWSALRRPCGSAVVDLPTLGRPMMATSMVSVVFLPRRMRRRLTCAARRRGDRPRRYRARGYREDRRADSVENVGVGFLRHGIHFVHGNHKRFASGAQEPAEFFVEGVSPAWLSTPERAGQPSDGYMRLAEDFLRDQCLVVRDDAASIYDFQRAAAPLGFAVDAVTRDARLVGDDSAARAGQND